MQITTISTNIVNISQTMKQPLSTATDRPSSDPYTLNMDNEVLLENTDRL